MKNTTIVTALYNIQRQNMDGRSWDEYLDWFSKTLKINCPMVIFVEENLVDFIKKNRDNTQTKIIVQKLEEIPYYYLKDKIDLVIQSKEYKDKIGCSDRIECNYSLYSIIQYSKFKWIEEAIRINCFDSDYYFWLDAGASRFFENYNLELKFPGKYAMESLYEIGEKFLIQLNTETYHDLVLSKKMSKDYFYDPRSFVCGTFFGVHKNIHYKILKNIETILVNDMIENNNLNNEQIALAYLVKNNPEFFEIYYRNNWKQIALFEELSK
jgi:hypothetical protein